MEKIKLYVFRDENNSIVALDSSFYLEHDESYEVLTEVGEDDPDYKLVKYARSQEYAREKFGKYLVDTNLRPNFHDNWVEWTEEEKQEKYPIPERELSELEKLKKRQDITEQALQDLILATLSM